MQIDIIGGGSLGMLFGARLAETGADVTIWTRSREQSLLLEQRGIMLQKLEGDKVCIKVHSNWIQHAAAERQMKSNERQSPRCRWIILTVKQTDINDQLLELLAALAAGSEQGDSSVVCLQNGMGHLDRIRSRLPHTPLYAGVTTEGAKRLDGHSVMHTGKGQLWVGPWHENKRKPDDTYENKLKMLISLLQSAGFTSFLSKEMENRIFNKLLINAVINPLTGIFDRTNGELPSDRIRLMFMQQLYAETELILLKAGMEPVEDGFQRVLDVCSQTSSNISSMLSDVRAGKVTEIDAINGGILRLAEQLQLDAPLNQAVTTMIHALHPKPIVEE